LPGSDAIDYAGQSRKLAAAVREAGAIALKTFRGTIKSWTKGHDSPVSEADIAVDDFLRGALAQPGVGWLSEETLDDLARLESRLVHVVDPIDGTRAYLAGFPDWAISAALVEDGRPVAAALFAPVTDELFVAARGQGATLNEMPMTASGGDTLDGAKVAGPKGYLERFARLGPQIGMVPKIHSLALRLTRVAQGEIDAAFASANSRDWDLAAADLLVHEAGGALTTATGEPVVYNLQDPVHGALLAAGRARHGRMLDLVRDRWKQIA
jgi:myo-inositol-1(or 4)-monophosphatase